MMLQQTADAINANELGSKSRFTHPSLSGDGLGKFLGRFTNAVVDGDRVRADLHIAESAHSTPEGNLADYVMTLAETDPEAFGSSIAFAYDMEAEEEFVIANGGEQFVSPDPDNQSNLPHARLKKLRAVDVVDTPAANPTGLFHSGQEIATEADALLAYALGLSDARPESNEFDIDPDRLSGFVLRFFDRHGVSLWKEHTKLELINMAEQKPEEKPEEKPAEVKPVVEEPKPVEHKPEEPKPAEEPKLGQKFLDAFGEKGGVWYAEGKSFDEATALYVKELKSENDQLKANMGELQKQLTASRGEQSPVSFQAEQPPEKKSVNELANKSLGDNLAKFAAGIKIGK